MTSDARLLVADDNPENRDVLIRRLQRLGYTRIESAADGVEALTMNAAAPFDAILLDVMMPHKNGVEVLEEMRAQGRLEATPVIMVSAATELEIVVRCIQLGAEDYLTKPLNPTLLAARLGSVLEKYRLRADLRRQLARLEAEMAEARQQQLRMVPDTFPCRDGTTVHAAMYPAREVGGDFYDCFEVTAGTLCIAVGDVSGKGMPAALFMARTRSLLRAATLLLHRLTGRVPEPEAVAAVINEELVKNNPLCNFVTLFMGLLDTGSGTLRYLNAGHVRPTLLARNTEPTEMPCRVGLALGFQQDIRYHVGTLTLSAGDALVIMTDGVHDMKSAEGAMFGQAATRACLAAAADRRPLALVSGLIGATFAFADGVDQEDDVTVLALLWQP